MSSPREHFQPISFFVLVCSMCWLLCGTANAAPSISLSKKSGPPTSRILVSGRGFEANVAVDIFFDTKDKALAVTNGKGEFHHATIYAPRTAHPGEHWITALQRNNDKGAQEPFLIQTNWLQLGFDNARKGNNPYENVLSAASVENLSLRWSYSDTQQGWPYGESPIVNDGILYIGHGIKAYYLDALRSSTGTVLWRHRSPAPFGTTSAVADNTIYAFSDYALHALDALTGVELWRYETCRKGGCAGTVSSPLVANGIVYVNMGDGTDTAIYALNGATGTLLWKWDAPPGGFLFPPALADGMVFTGSVDHNVYALKASTGALVWSYTTTNWVSGGPTVANGVVYALANDGTVYALNEQSGELLWQDVIDVPVGLNLAISEGVLYVAGPG